jgi:hypothetical protein
MQPISAVLSAWGHGLTAGRDAAILMTVLLAALCEVERSEGDCAGVARFGPCSRLPAAIPGPRVTKKVRRLAQSPRRPRAKSSLPRYHASTLPRFHSTSTRYCYHRYHRYYRPSPVRSHTQRNHTQKTLCHASDASLHVSLSPTLTCLRYSRILGTGLPLFLFAWVAARLEFAGPSTPAS